MGLTHHNAPRTWQRVRGLVFDMGDVLYDATLWRRWLWQLLSRQGLHVEYGRFFHVWDTQYLGEVHRGGRPYQEAFEAFLSSFGLSRGWIDEVEAASQARRRELESTLRPLPGVRATLVQLRAAGVPMAVLSDSESTGRELAQRLDKLGLKDCFAAVISSLDLKQTKPAAACYRAALDALALPAKGVAFVGHELEELVGAQQAGLATVAFNYEPDARADAFIERFDELLSLVEPAHGLAAAG